MKQRIFLFYVLLCGLLAISSVFASDPDYYIKKDTWHKTLIASREELVKLEQLGEVGSQMPDFGVSDFTVLAWIKTTADNGAIFSKAPSRRRTWLNPAFLQESQSKALYLKNGALVYETASVGSINSERKVNDGLWHFISFSGKNPFEFYVDGTLIKSGQVGAPETISSDHPDHLITIGFGSMSFPQGGGFLGDMDEVRIYNRQLSAKEIKTIYRTAKKLKKGMAGWWKFEKKGNDSSINKNDGRIFRAESIVGKIGQGLQFNGRSGLSLPSSASITSRTKLWELVSRDFPDERSQIEIEREKQDNIWGRDWKAGDMRDLANRYARATKNIGELPERAERLADEVKNLGNLQKVSDIYHLSIINNKIYGDLVAKSKIIRSGIKYLVEQYGQTYSRSEEYLARLEEPEQQLTQLIQRPADIETLNQLKKEFQEVQYEALVKDNLLIDFDQVLFVKRYTYQSSHYYTDFIDGCDNPGGNLCILSLKDGSVTEIVPSMNYGIFGRYDLSFDGKRIVFDWKESLEKGFRLYEVGIDGAGLRQLTFEPHDEQERIKTYDNSFTGVWKGVYNHHTDDMHPCYLPDGGIVFTSTRCEYGTLCDGPDVLSTAVLYRMDGDGKNIKKLTNSAVSEFSPAVMNDGRIIYSRWEYVDKGQIGVKCLWAMRPDGSGTEEIYGNDIALPPVFIHSRPIPGSNHLFIALGTPHFPQSGVGTVIRLDINHPIRTREPMTYITPDVDIRAEGGFHHKIEDRWVRTPNGPLYMDPYPLNDKFFLVSHNPDKAWNDIRAYGLYLLDEFGNHVPIYQDPEFSCWQPMPLVSRVTPPVIPSLRVEQPDREDQATVVMSDVYVGLEGVERGTVKYLRIMEQVPRPWSARKFWDQHNEYGSTGIVSRGTVLGLKVLHGIVPVYSDGSAYFIVPANKNVYFQALDENFMEIQRERTYINYRSGEKRTCIGCHTLRRLAPANKPIMALKYSPSKPEAQPGDIAPRPIDFPMDVQPILDKYCVSCHGGSEVAADLDLSGEMTDLFSRSYENIIRRGLVVTTNEGSDFDGTEPVQPRSIGSHASKLITVLREGHYDVTLDREEFIKLVTWVDANAQYYGMYYGRKNVIYKDHPDFRPVPSFDAAISTELRGEFRSIEETESNQ